MQLFARVKGIGAGDARLHGWIGGHSLDIKIAAARPAGGFLQFDPPAEISDFIAIIIRKAAIGRLSHRMRCAFEMEHHFCQTKVLIERASIIRRRCDAHDQLIGEELIRRDKQAAGWLGGGARRIAGHRSKTGAKRAIPARAGLQQ